MEQTEKLKVNRPKNPFNLLKLIGIHWTQCPTTAEYPSEQEIVIEIKQMQDHKTGLNNFF